MSQPLALVRAEIKGWERDFASRHGRDPSLQDIRDHPSIADKYKLYKKLSKTASNRNPSATPPQSRSRLPVPKSRPAESVSPLPGFNPFSPAKKAARHDHSQPSRASCHPSPFATPAKNISNARQHATPSPDPFPPILPHSSPTASSSRGRVSANAVSRARKRLRGEPVSPSPNKPKRQRIRSQARPKLGQDSSDSEHEPEQELPQCDFTVADSPVKAASGGKSFKLLFDDSFPVLSTTRIPISSSSASLDAPLDARPGSSLRTFVDPSVQALLSHGTKPKGVASATEHRANHVQGKIDKIFPPKAHLLASSNKPALETLASQLSQSRSSIKHALHGGDLVREDTGLIPPSQSRYSLVPPSPPPPDSNNRDAGKKATTNAKRKKPRVEDEESDEGMDSPDDITLRVTTASFDRGKHLYRHVDDLGWDPLLHLGTRNHDPAAMEGVDANHHASGTFSVDLPDKLRRMLAISPSRCQNITEERVVRGLLYGDRVGHYDPSKGGNIWDAGETDEGAQGDIETEDDWEGEPVPWEVGEL